MGSLSALIKLFSRLLVKRSYTWQKNSLLRELGLWGVTKDALGHMKVQGLSTAKLAAEFGTPLLVVNQEKLNQDIQAMQKAMGTVPGAKILYSYKTNCIPGILQAIHAQEIGAEVISPYELWLAQRLKVPGEMIIYNGVNKTDESLVSAINYGILAINIDHLDEIERIVTIAKDLGVRAKVGVRLGLVDRSQFGLALDTGEAREACKRIYDAREYLDFTCVHFNVTSNAKTANTHKEYALKALDFVKDIQEMGLSTAYLDVGGGIGVPTSKNMTAIEYAQYRTFGVLPKPPNPSDFQPISSYLADISNTVVEYCRRNNMEVPRLIFEPGRHLTSRAEFLLCRVLTIKQKGNGTDFVITDAGRLSTTFPCDFEYHEVFVATKIDQKIRTKPYQVMGRICTSADWLVKNKYLPEIEEGDLIAIMDAGAYFSSYSSNFSFPRPAIVKISNGQTLLIRHEETYEHLIGMDSFE
ncbi:diaminopimelate decarboxylase [Thermodesulfobacteriota bacterium]